MSSTAWVIQSGTVNHWELRVGVSIHVPGLAQLEKEIDSLAGLLPTDTGSLMTLLSLHYAYHMFVWQQNISLE